MGCLVIIFVIFIGAFFAVNKFVCFWCKSYVCLVGKTALITGGASGIGYSTAIALASKGCRVIIADVVDTTKAVQDIIGATHNPHIFGKKVDLASFESVRDLVKEIYESEPRLDILINNAGVGNVNISYTDDGLERTMQINYFGHFLLTHLLLDLLKKSSPSRIVFTSSVVAYLSNLTVENLNPKREYGSARKIIFNGGSYGASKLCMALAAKMFGEKLTGTGVTSNAFHPGGTRTAIFFTSIGTWRDLFSMFVGFFTWSYGKTPEEGAQTVIYLAHADEVENATGKYFMEGRPVFQPRRLKNKKFCEEIWERSILYTKLDPHEVKC